MKAKQYVAELIAIFIAISGSFYVENLRNDYENEENIQFILKLIKDDLEADIQEINDVEQYYIYRPSLYDSVLKGALTMDHYNDYTYCNECYSLVVSAKPFVVNKSGYELLKSGIEISEFSNLELLKEIEEFYSNITFGTNYIVGLILEDNENIQRRWRDNYPWFKSYIQDTHDPPAEMKEYLINSKEYSNLVAYHKGWIVNNYLPFLKDNKNQSVRLIHRIERELDQVIYPINLLINDRVHDPNDAIQISDLQNSTIHFTMSETEKIETSDPLFGQIMIVDEGRALFMYEADNFEKRLNLFDIVEERNKSALMAGTELLVLIKNEEYDGERVLRYELSN